MNLQSLLYRYQTCRVLLWSVKRPLLLKGVLCLFCWGITVYERLLFLEVPLISLLVAFDQPLEVRDSRYTGIRLRICGQAIEWSVEELAVPDPRKARMARWAKRIVRTRRQRKSSGP